MKKEMIWKLLFFWMLLLGAVCMVSGCAGPERSQDVPVKVEKPHGQKTSKAVTGSPERQDKDKVDGDKVEPKVIAVSSEHIKDEENKAERDLRRSTSKKELTAPAAAKAVQPAQPKDEPGKGGRIIFNFDDADLYEVIKTIADILKINYIVDPGIKGRVTIHTAGGLSKRDLFPVFFQILEANGLTAIKEGSLYKIVPLKDASRMPINSRFGLEGEKVPPRERIIIQIIPLKFISSQEIIKILTPFISAGGTIVSDKGSNTVLVVDKGANILKILRLVEAFDINIFERTHYRFYPIKNLDSEEVAKIMSDFSSSYGDTANVSVKFISISKLNSLLAISSTPLVFDKVEEILRKIDIVVQEAEPKIHVYFVKNGEAKGLAELLDKVFSKKQSEKGKTEKETKKKADSPTAGTGNPFSRSRMEQKKAEKEAKSEEKEVPRKTPVSSREAPEGTGTLRGEIIITADETRNALIIKATHSDYLIIQDILRRIDILPRQVLIEATIAEITIDTSTELGMEWALGKGAAAGGTGSFAATINKLIGTGTDTAYSGLKYAIGVTDSWYAALRALASEGKVNVISSPHVLASDNKEAKIDVSREIPVASSQTTYATATALTETAIEYRDTGVILSVTPHINERGLVTMDISEEVSDLEKKNIEVGGRSYPAFFKRTVKTTCTVRDGQTIVIGGLIKDKEDESMTGVPCLIKIPVVRYLFGQWGKSVEKIELIVLITPRVIVDLDDVDAVTDEFKQKVKNVIRRFYQ